MIGDVFPAEKREFNDPRTGAAITQFTAAGTTNRTLYFTNRPFTHAGSRLAFLSDRTGKSEMYSLELDSGKIVQLTDVGVTGNVSSCVHATRNELFFHTGASIFRANIDTLKTDELLRAPDGFRVGILHCAGAGRLAFEAIEQLPQGMTRMRPLADKPFQASKPAGAESLYLRPKSLLYFYDIDEDKLECAWGEHKLLTHVQLSPTNPDLLIFSDWDGYNGADRCQWIDLAAPRKRTPQSMFPESKNARGCHEAFTRRGNAYTQWMEGDLRDGKKKTLLHAFRKAAGLPTEQVATAAFEKYELPERRDYLWHHFTMANDETWGLHDRWLTAPDEASNAQHLCVFRHQKETPQTIAEHVCFIGESKNDRAGLGPECHLDDRDEYACFTGFIGGPTHLYRVDLRPAVERLFNRRDNG